MTKYAVSRLLLSVLAILAVPTAGAIEMDPPDPPPNPPPCSIGKDDPGCPVGQTEYHYLAKLCPDLRDKYLCQAPVEPFYSYMLCDSWGDGADCVATPQLGAPTNVTYSWSKTGRVILNVYGKSRERATVACGSIRGTGAVTLTVKNQANVISTTTEYFNCNL